MKQLFMFLVIQLFLIGQSSFGEDKKAVPQNFKIVYLADEAYARDYLWLNKIKYKWHATGINLRIHRSTWVEHPVAYWKEIRMALDSIKKNSLDVYIRISMGFLEKEWEQNRNYDQNNGIHRRYDGSIYYNYHSPQPDSPRAILNLTQSSRQIYLSFIDTVLNKLNEWQDSVRNTGNNADIELIVVTISPDDECELPSAGYDRKSDKVFYELTGYTDQENLDFINFLKNEKYPGKKGFSDLQRIWEATNLTSWDSIQIKNYNWHDIWQTYTYPAGRKDFIDFRNKQLVDFYNACYGKISNTRRNNGAGYKFGLQFGSIYDGLIDMKGFYDPTMLVKNADYIINDDVPEYSLQFNFAGDYLRSLCNYWDRLNPKNSNRIFGTETNWPEYRNLADSNLMYYWSEQLNSYYNKGAMILFVSHWGTNNKSLSTDTAVVDAIKNGSLENRYSLWANILNSKKGQSQAGGLNNFPVIHLSTEQVLNSRDTSAPYYDAHKYNQSDTNGVLILGDVKWMHFPLYYFTKPRNSYEENNIYYNENCDIITNQMIINSPNYLDNHYANQIFYFNETSFYMPREAYEIMITKDQNGFLIDNATQNSSNTWMFTPGTKNERNQTQSSFYPWSYMAPSNPLNIQKQNSFEYKLLQNYPNPFNPTTKIEFSIPLENNVEIKVFNVLGEEITTLLNERMEAGKHSVEFGANGLSSGIYFYKVVSGSYSEIKKMMLLR